MSDKVARNDPCPCGSGKKYKKCCLAADEDAAPRVVPADEDEPLFEDDFDAALGDGLDLTDGSAPDRFGLHPYAVARFIDEGGARIKLPPGYPRLSEVAAMTTEAIEARLRELHVDPSREKFLEMAASRTSAWTIADAWLEALGTWPEDRDAQFLGLAACELWKRHCPERPSLEIVDDWVDEGFVLEKKGKPAALDAWWRAWAWVRARLAPGMRTLEAAREAYDGSHALGEWLDRFAYVLRGKLARREDTRPGIELARAVLAQFPDEERAFRKSLEKTLAHLEKKQLSEN